MNDYTRPTHSKKRSGTQTNAVTQRKNTASARARKKKRKRGLRIGGYTVRARFIALLFTLIIIIGVIIGINTQPPELYDIDYGSITMYETVDAVLIKSETGYTYPEGITVVSRLPDGTYVEAGDVIAVVRSGTFNNDWYHLLNLARQETFDYMTKRLDPEREDHAKILEAVSVVDNTIATLSEEMLGVIVTSPELYSQYSRQLKELYRQKRDTLFKAFNGDGNLDELISKEELHQSKIDENTLEITAVRSGILSYNTDGYANMYNYDSIDSVTETVFDNIVEDSYTSAIKKSRGLCDYYISDMDNCYVVMKGYGDIFKYLKDNDEAIVRINNSNTQHVTDIKNVKELTGCNYVVAEITGDLSGLYRDRVVSVTVQKTWSGLVVPREHVVKKREKEGVYVYDDKKKTFVSIEISAQNESVIVLNTESVNNIFKKGTTIVKQ